MANYSRWEDIKKRRAPVAADARTGIEQDLALGQLIYDLRTAAGLSQRELAERMGTTQSVISRLEEGGGAKNRLDTLAAWPPHSKDTSSSRFPRRCRPGSRTRCKSPSCEPRLSEGPRTRLPRRTTDNSRRVAQRVTLGTSC